MWAGLIVAAGFASGRTDGRAAPDRGPSLAQRRVRPAPGALHAPAAPLLRLPRPPPDGTAALARDERRQRDAHVPGLRPRLHHAVRRVADRRLGAARDHELAAGDHHVRAAPADRHRGGPLLAPLASGAARRAAAHRRRHHAGRGVDRRRARRQGLRAGGHGDVALRRAGRARVRARDRLDAPPGELPAAARPPAAAGLRGDRPGRRPARDRQAALAGRLLRLQPLPRDADLAAAHDRHVDRPVPARHRLGRAHLRAARRGARDQRSGGAPRRCPRAAGSCASSTSRSATTPTGPCCASSISRSPPAAPSP